VNPTADVPCNTDTSGASMWLKIVGGKTELDSSEKQQIFNKELKFNTGWDQDFFGIVGGVDWGSTWDNGSGAKEGWYGGILLGYVTSQQDFDTGGSSDYDAGMIGAYATYLNGGWFADAMLAAQFGNVDVGFSGFGDEQDAYQLGFTFDTGYRFGSLPGQDGLFLEPGASISFLSTNVDNFGFEGVDVDLEDATSARGRLGARAGFSAGAWEPFIFLDIWHDWSNDPSVTLTSFNGFGSSTATLEAEGFGTWVEFGGGFDVVDLGDGWSAFAKADFRYNDDLWGWTGQGGFRYDFQ